MASSVSSAKAWPILNDHKASMYHVLSFSPEALHMKEWSYKLWRRFHGQKKALNKFQFKTSFTRRKINGHVLRREKSICHKFYKHKSGRNKLHEQKAGRKKFHVQNQFYEEKNQYTSFTNRKIKM